MLKNNFAAAKNASKPLEQSQEIGAESQPDLGASGNAFVGSRAKYDDEMHHAIRGAIMNGDTGGNSSIANAGMRLAAKFGSAATKSEKDAEKSRALYVQVMMQQLHDMRADLEAALDGMRERQGELDEQLEALARLRELVNDGDFDPTNPEHLAIYNRAFDNDPEKTAEEFALETQSLQNDIIGGTEDDVQAEQARLSIRTNELDRALAEVNFAIENGTALETDGIEFVNPVFEQARVGAGESIDASDLTQYGIIREGLRDHLDDNLEEQYRIAKDADNVEEQLGANSLFASLGNLENLRR